MFVVYWVWCVCFVSFDLIAWFVLLRCVCCVCLSCVARLVCVARFVCFICVVCVDRIVSCVLRFVCVISVLCLLGACALLCVAFV